MSFFAENFENKEKFSKKRIDGVSAGRTFNKSAQFSTPIQQQMGQREDVPFQLKLWSLLYIDLIFLIKHLLFLVRLSIRLLYMHIYKVVLMYRLYSTVPDPNMEF